MGTKSKGTSKNLDLGPLMARVKKIAKQDPVLKTDAAVIRAAVSVYADEWERKHPDIGQGRA